MIILLLALQFNFYLKNYLTGIHYSQIIREYRLNKSLMLVLFTPKFLRLTPIKLLTYWFSCVAKFSMKVLSLFT